MENSVYFLKRFGFALALVISWSFVQAQAPSTLQDKQQLEQMSGANYDLWKAATAANNEVEPNKVLTTSIAGGHTTYLIQLGYTLTNQAAESHLETKISGQPGVISFDADFNTNTVEMTIKEEDEHNALYSYFGIE